MIVVIASGVSNKETKTDSEILLLNWSRTHADKANKPTGTKVRSSGHMINRVTVVRKIKTFILKISTF